MRPGDRQQAIRASFDALQSGAFEQARAHAEPFLDPGDIEVTLLAGLAIAACGDADRAAPLLNQVALARPTALHPAIDLVTVLQTRFRAREAEPVFQACLALTPDDAKLGLGYAQLLCDLQRPRDAMRVVEHSLALMPDFPPALNQKAIILVSLGRSEQAIALFRAVTEADPDNAPAWANLGCVLAAEGGFEEALSAYRRSIHIKPAEPQVRLNHSICLLKAGRMLQGWQEHEWRFRLPGHTDLPLDRLLPTLTPGADLAGRSVLLTHEEGIGDTLMFLRYAPLLAGLGARVIAWVPQNLARLVARVEGIASVASGDTLRLEADTHCPFISLPRAFGAHPGAWGAPVPYLSQDPARVAAMAGHMPAARPGTLRVGLVWGGAARADNLSAAAIDARRSLPLARLAPLGASDGIRLVSLQHGGHADQLLDPPDGMAVLDPMPAVIDMDDTASLIAHLDVVVSVDTSIVHLAGGLGVPTILIDRYDNCWRWFHGRTDSPWYPTLTIVRQERPGDWDGVVARVAEMLRGMVGR